MSTHVSNTCGLDSVEVVVVVDTTTCLVAESSALECYRSSANACSFKTRSQEEEEEESSWEELVFDDAVMPDTMADAWVVDDRTDRANRAVLDWSVGGCSDGLKPGGVAFTGLPRWHAHNLPLNLEKLFSTVLYQIQQCYRVLGGFENCVDYLAVHCEEVNILLLIHNLFRKLDDPETNGLDDMILNLIIPVVIEQRKEELRNLFRNYPICFYGFPHKCKCLPCLEQIDRDEHSKRLSMQEQQQHREDKEFNDSMGGKKCTFDMHPHPGACRINYKYM